MATDPMTGAEIVAKKSPADAFEEMARRIRHNSDSPFGGAVVIVPPEGGGDVVNVLLLDATTRVADFWSMLSSRIQSEVAEIDAKQQQQNPYRR